MSIQGTRENQFVIPIKDHDPSHKREGDLKHKQYYAVSGIAFGAMAATIWIETNAFSTNCIHPMTAAAVNLGAAGIGAAAISMGRAVIGNFKGRRVETKTPNDNYTVLGLAMGSIVTSLGFGLYSLSNQCMHPINASLMNLGTMVVGYAIGNCKDERIKGE